MKKSIFILPALFILAAIVFVSCSKKGNYTCECTWNIQGQTIKQDVVLNDVTESDAKAACNWSKQSVSFGGITGITGECTLK